MNQAVLVTPVLSFGGGFLDYDNDGRLDLFIANGHVYQGVEKTAPDIHYKQINSLFHNEGNGKFIDVTALSGSGLSIPHLGRCVAFADFDNDGYMDIMVANNGDPPVLLKNGRAASNHFVNFKLVGTRSNRDGIGARIKLRSGDTTQIREIMAGGSYLSQSDLRANFGLGAQTDVDAIEISWPSGVTGKFENIRADRFYKVIEGQSRLSELMVGTK